jgi:hypothetical protein
MWISGTGLVLIMTSIVCALSTGCGCGAAQTPHETKASIATLLRRCGWRGRRQPLGHGEHGASITIRFWMKGRTATADEPARAFPSSIS